MTPLGMLREFHRAMGLDLDVFHVGKDLLRLRMRLVREEYEEVREEFEKAVAGRLDREALTKELADLVYVTYGFAASLGIDLDGALQEVHRSNMTKLDPATGRPFKDAGGKVIKPPTYSPADVWQFSNSAIDHVD
jgi:predicted HAD superfamily Cof-like phosphohydrolase